MSTESSAFEDRFVLFFDFLGTQEAVKNWPRERLHAFLELLISIAQLQSAESISMNLQDDGSARLDVKPEVTTFSDHVVVSYRRPGDVEPPLTAPKKAIETFTSHWTKIVCEDAIRILSGVAEMGLQIGLLIRGGLSLGQLHHENGVVFGEAMIDAYTLECKVANPSYSSPRAEHVGDRMI